MPENKEEQGLQKSDYEFALFSQSACNLSGVVFSFTEIMERICVEARLLGKGTDWRNNHPICRLFAEQIYHLTKSTDWQKAYEECERKSKE